MITGSCECREIKYQLDGDITDFCHCHCSQCRRMHGAAFASFAGVSKSDFSYLSGNPVLDRYGKPTGEYMRQISAANQALSLMGEFLGYKLDRKAVMTMDITKMSEAQLEEAEAQLEALVAKDKVGTVH